MDTPSNPLAGSSAGWRPSEWSEPALTVITVPGNATSPSNGSDPITGAPLPQTGSSNTIYVFDGVFRLDHARELRTTDHPVQYGANVSDHAYRMPARVTMEIGMSDAMDSYQAGMWNGSQTKSINAYQILVGLQNSRTLLRLTTRIDSVNYTSMLIESISAADTFETRYGLKATIVFREIILVPQTTATSSSISYGNVVSAIPETTQSSTPGPVQGIAPPASLYSQYNVNGASNTAASNAAIPSDVPGAGTWSSNAFSG